VKALRGAVQHEETEMLSNGNAYEAEIQYRRQQLRKDLARRQQAKQAKLARHNSVDPADCETRPLTAMRRRSAWRSL